MILGATSLIINKDSNPTSDDFTNQLQTYETYTTNGYPVLNYRVRNCDTNLTSQNPATQYQRQKLIQNTVRVPSSLYTMNLGSLSSYQQAKSDTYKVCWNQMSDRVNPSYQKYVVASGTTYGGNSTKRSITRLRPGAMSPGGYGVDIKHNSYDRHLNRLKSKADLRRGIIPPDYGEPIIFNRAYPIYGGKTVKTSIINGCNCPILETNNHDPASIYNNENTINNIYNVSYQYSVGQTVYAQLITDETAFVAVTIVSINNINKTYEVEFSDGTIITKNEYEITPFYDYKCVNTGLNPDGTKTSEAISEMYCEQKLINELENSSLIT